MEPTDFNARPEAELRAALTACADVPAWVDGVLAGRPYPTADAAAERADVLARGWSDADVERALAQHPRIGERHAGAGAEAAHSAAEQASVTTGADAQARLRAGNAAYETRFDRVFLIRAAGRGAADVLAALEARLRNDDATERAVVRDQLREIALLRLQRLLEPQEDPA